MQDNSSSINRYSDNELTEFKNHIEQKLNRSMQQLNLLKDRIENISEVSGNDGDWMDDSSNSQDIDMLNAMMGRQQKHIRDLENALIRIQNKRYGICVISGQLIDKRRLMAVPTTTKSVLAKNGMALNSKPIEFKKKKTNAPTSFSKVIKRTGGTTVTAAKTKDNFFDEDEDDDDLDLDTSSGDINLDELVDGSTDD